MKAPRSSDLRSRFPASASARQPVDIAPLRRKAFREGLIVIDTRSQEFRAQPWAVAILAWYTSMMGA